MNDSRTDYLKAIYEEGLDTIVTNKLLAEKLNVAPSSVSEMLSKLNDIGLVNIIPYKGCKLTDIGIEKCRNIDKIHKLWEVFLIEHLDFTWREAHEDAHLLEHATSDRLLERLDKFLNYPKNSPHGGSIPQKNSNNILQKLKSLNEYEVNEEVIISSVKEDGNLLDYLWSLGLEMQEKIKIISKAPYEGPITIIQNNKEIMISYKAACQIYVNHI